MNMLSKRNILSSAAPIITGLKLHKLFVPFFAGLGHILTLHRVVKDSDSFRVHNHNSLEISPDQLEQTILFYKKRNYKFLSLDELEKNLRSKNPFDKFVVFTFDDGYKDNFTLAYPILKRHNVPFTIYVTTSFPDGNAILWWYLLEEKLKQNDSLSFSWKGQQHNFVAETSSQKEATFNAVKTFINQSFSIEEYQEMLQCIFHTSKSELYKFSKTLPMSWAEIIAISKDPFVTIGAHSVNHFPLKKMKKDDLKKEIINSKIRLEEKINKSVRHFAYPFGKASEASMREFKLVKSLNFKTATTTRMANIFPEHKDHLTCLPRISLNRISNDAILDLQSSGFLPGIFHRGKRIVTD